MTVFSVPFLDPPVTAVPPPTAPLPIGPSAPAGTVPDAYADWTGGFSDLVSVANSVLHQIDPTAAPITERSARHYQQVGALGRGTKSGRTALFSAPDLAALVATKGLIKEGFPLAHVPQVMAVEAGGPAFLSSASNSFGAGDGVSVGCSTPDAVGVVAALMSNAGLSPTGGAASEAIVTLNTVAPMSLFGAAPFVGSSESKTMASSAAVARPLSAAAHAYRARSVAAPIPPPPVSTAVPGAAARVHPLPHGAWVTVPETVAAPEQRRGVAVALRALADALERTP